MLYEVITISDAIRQLNQYKRDLPRKIETLIAAMVAYGEDYAINEVRNNFV